MKSDVPELDFREYVERRRAAVCAALGMGRMFLIQARARFEVDKSLEAREFLVMSMACVEVGEAELEALSVEFL